MNLFAIECFPRCVKIVRFIAQQLRTQTRMFDVFGIIDRNFIHVIRKVRSVQVFWFPTHLLFVVYSDFEISGVAIFITFTNEEILIEVGGATDHFIFSVEWFCDYAVMRSVPGVSEQI